MLDKNRLQVARRRQVAPDFAVDVFRVSKGNGFGPLEIEIERQNGARNFNSHRNAVGRVRIAGP